MKKICAILLVLATPAAAEEFNFQEIVITGKATKPPRSESILRGESLIPRISNTLGQTLAEEPGVQNASFGPGVGVPVIRGLTGPRVRTLSNGIGSHDASSTSPDHAITIEPLLAEEIEILRGPAVVRYGGSALGGAVNVKDARIPEFVPEDGIDASSEVRYGANGDEKAGAARITAGARGAALHVNGFRRQRGDMRIPGGALDEEAIRRQFGLSAVSNSYGRVPNTDYQGGGGTVGGSFRNQHGSVGASYQKLSNEYGLPKGGHGLGHSHGGAVHGENVRVDMDQERTDGRFAWTRPVPFLDDIVLEAGRVNYKHDEVDSGVTGTTFHNKVDEGRLETRWWTERWSGSAGIHGLDRDFSAVGNESFVPPSNIQMGAAYFRQHWDMARFALEFGARAEKQVTRPDNRTHEVDFITTVNLPEQFSFTPKSLSFVADWAIVNRWQTSLSFNWAERAPDVQELLSAGPHLATRSFDNGNLRLEIESSRQWDLGLGFQGERSSFKANVFYNDVNNYIHQRNEGYFYDVEARVFQTQCGSLTRCLPVYAYQSADARLVGGEAEIGRQLFQVSGFSIESRLFTDTVRGRFDDEERGDLPRLPPWRYGAKLEAIGEKTVASLRWTRQTRQDRPGLRETETPAANILSARVHHRFAWGKHGLLVFLRGENLLNDEIRSSVSFLRNFAPEPGRSVEIGARFDF